MEIMEDLIVGTIGAMAIRGLRRALFTSPEQKYAARVAALEDLTRRQGETIAQQQGVLSHVAAVFAALRNAPLPAALPPNPTAAASGSTHRKRTADSEEWHEEEPKRLRLTASPVDEAQDSDYSRSLSPSEMGGTTTGASEGSESDSGGSEQEVSASSEESGSEEDDSESEEGSEDEPSIDSEEPASEEDGASSLDESASPSRSSPSTGQQEDRQLLEMCAEMDHRLAEAFTALQGREQAGVGTDGSRGSDGDSADDSAAPGCLGLTAVEEGDCFAIDARQDDGCADTLLQLKCPAAPLLDPWTATPIIPGTDQAGHDMQVDTPTHAEPKKTPPMSPQPEVAAAQLAFGARLASLPTHSNASELPAWRDHTKTSFLQARAAARQRQRKAGSKHRRAGIAAGFRAWLRVLNPFRRSAPARTTSRPGNDDTAPRSPFASRQETGVQDEAAAVEDAAAEAQIKPAVPAPSDMEEPAEEFQVHESHKRLQDQVIQNAGGSAPTPLELSKTATPAEDEEHPNKEPTKFMKTFAKPSLHYAFKEGAAAIQAANAEKDRDEEDEDDDMSICEESEDEEEAAVEGGSNGQHRVNQVTKKAIARMAALGSTIDREESDPNNCDLVGGQVPEDEMEEPYTHTAADAQGSIAADGSTEAPPLSTLFDSAPHIELSAVDELFNRPGARKASWSMRLEEEMERTPSPKPRANDTLDSPFRRLVRVPPGYWKIGGTPERTPAANNSRFPDQTPVESRSPSLSPIPTRSSELNTIPSRSPSRSPARRGQLDLRAALDRMRIRGLQMRAARRFCEAEDEWAEEELGQPLLDAAGRSQCGTIAPPPHEKHLEVGLAAPAAAIVSELGTEEVQEERRRDLGVAASPNRGGSAREAAPAASEIIDISD